jgi:hypothetical protein
MPGRRLLLVWLFLLFVSLYVLTSSGRISPGDEETMYQVTRNLIEHGTIAVDSRLADVPAQSYPGFLPTRSYSFETTIASDGLYGRKYSPYGPGQSLATIPLYLVGRALPVAWPAAPSQYLPKLLMQWLNAFILAAIIVLVVYFGWSLGYSTGIGLSLGLALGVGTMLWPYVKTFYSEPGAALCLLFSAFAAYRFRVG